MVNNRKYIKGIVIKIFDNSKKHKMDSLFGLMEFIEESTTILEKAMNKAFEEGFEAGKIDLEQSINAQKSNQS